MNIDISRPLSSEQYRKQQEAYYARKIEAVILESEHLLEDRRQGEFARDMLAKGKHLCFPFALGYIEDDRERNRLFALEALYVALTHNDPIIAMRAYVSACIAANKVPNSFLSDACHVARDRIEAFLQHSAE